MSIAPPEGFQIGGMELALPQTYEHQALAEADEFHKRQSRAIMLAISDEEIEGRLKGTWPAQREIER